MMTNHRGRCHGASSESNTKWTNSLTNSIGKSMTRFELHCGGVASCSRYHKKKRCCNIEILILF